MTRPATFRLISSFVFLALCLTAKSALADSSHVRIIRLSYVQGDVRIAHDISGDPLQTGDTAWERATLNMPIHQADAIATDNGRAEVEFESGNVAFLAENTVLEFYDLSLDDGSFTTRLILRQGSASFYVRPGRGDYFSVTGGDFSVEANNKAEFRVNNYDDGSDVQVFQGHISVLSKGKTTPVSKGQGFSVQAADPNSASVDTATNTDDFDQWVSGRIESGQAAVTSSQQYSGVYDYTSGFGDLYTYGGWYSVAGYGYCWRPYGVGYGWNPFQIGHWFFDTTTRTWVFIGSQPWGWLPYHYGNWIFEPGKGWVWTPVGSFPYGRSRSYAYTRGGQWKPVTGTWVKSGTQIGLVPTHPLDTRGKTPINLQQGVFPVSQRGVLDPVQVSTLENWKNLHKGPARDSLPTESTSAAAPSRVTRMMTAGGSATGVVAAGRESSGIAFDPAEHRFVNNSVARSTEREAVERSNGAVVGGKQIEPGNNAARNSDMRRGTETPGGRSASATSARGSMPPSARSSTPPTPPPASSSARGGSTASGGGGSRWGGSSGSSSSGGSSRSSSGGSSGSSSSSASSSRSSSSSSSSSSGSSSGGRPH